MIGDDTDLLVLLCMHADTNQLDIIFRSETKQKTKKMRVWEIKKTKEVLGQESCRLLPVIHAVTGCETTSRVFGIGKSAAIKKARKPSFTRHLRVFLNSSATPGEIKVTGEKLLVALYNDKERDDLNTPHFQRFCEKLSSSSSMVEVKPCHQQLQQPKTTVSMYSYKCKNGLERQTSLIQKSGVGFVRMENSFQLQYLYLLHQRVFSL